eukprot:2899003-Prymnesium_polylepis.1
MGLAVVGGLGPNATAPSWAPKDVAQKCARLRSCFLFSFDYRYSIPYSLQTTMYTDITIRTSSERSSDRGKHWQCAPSTLHTSCPLECHNLGEGSLHISNRGIGHTVRRHAPEGNQDGFVFLERACRDLPHLPTHQCACRDLPDLPTRQCTCCKDL